MTGSRRVYPAFYSEGHPDINLHRRSFTEKNISGKIRFYFVDFTTQFVNEDAENIKSCMKLNWNKLVMKHLYFVILECRLLLLLFIFMFFTEHLMTWFFTYVFLTHLTTALRTCFCLQCPQLQPPDGFHTAKAVKQEMMSDTKPQFSWFVTFEVQQN